MTQDKTGKTGVHPETTSDEERPGAAEAENQSTGNPPAEATQDEPPEAEAGEPPEPVEANEAAPGETRSEADVAAAEPPPDQPEAAPAPVPAAERPGIGYAGAIAATVLVLVVVGVVAFFTAPQWRPYAAAFLVPTERIEALAGRVEDLAGQVSGFEQTLSALRRDLADLRESAGQGGDAGGGVPVEAVTRLEERLAALESAQGDSVSPAHLEELRQQLGEIRQMVATVRENVVEAGTVLRLAERVEAAEQAVRQARSRSSAAESLLLAVGQLREAINRGGSFDAEFRALRILAEGNRELADPLAALAERTSGGIPTRTALAARFGDLATSIVRADFGPEQEGWLRRTVQRFSTIVSVKRTEGEAVGDSPAAIVARAEAALDQGDLGEAVGEVAKLDGPAAEAAAPWLADANARLAAERALSELSAAAVALNVAARG